MSKLRFILKNMGEALSEQDKRQVLKLIEKYNLYDWYLPAYMLEIEWRPLDNGMTIYSNLIWRDEVAANIETPNNLPRIEKDVNIQSDWILIEFNYIDKRSMGMGKFYGYSGYYLSLIVDLNKLLIIDARGEQAD